LLELFKKGSINKKDFDSVVNCSESDCNAFDEYSCNYYYNLPLFLNKLDKNDINLNFNININDIIIKDKKNIVIKRKKDNNTFIKTEFTFNFPEFAVEPLKPTYSSLLNAEPMNPAFIKDFAGLLVILFKM
jgi:hypothetical protein